MNDSVDIREDVEAGENDSKHDKLALNELVPEDSLVSVGENENTDVDVTEIAAETLSVIWRERETKELAEGLVDPLSDEVIEEQDENDGEDDDDGDANND